MTQRRAATLAFAAATLAWAALFAYLATVEPVLHDGWWHALAHAQRAFGPSALIDFVRHSYTHGNPRLGEWLTFAAFAPGPWHAMLAAAGAIGLVGLTFVLGFGRWPRPADLADTARVVAIAGLVFACIPNPGQMLCYRPFTGNYVWALVVTLGFAAPYRLGLARARAPYRGGAAAAAAAAMLVAGVLAGMSNEHTGPVALAAVATGAALIRRRDGRGAPIRAWTWTGLAGLAAGIALLLGAPGQSLRYHGLADQSSLLGNVIERGLAGNLRVIGMSMLYTCGSWLLIAIALLHGARDRARAPWRRDVVVLVIAALAIVATVLLSPKQGARLFVAPAILLLAAAVRAIDEAIACRVLRTALAIGGAALAVGGAIQLTRVQRAAGDDFDARVARLAAAPAGAAPAVPPYRRFAPTWWTFGDDFRAAPLRQHVARRVFGLDDVSLASGDRRLLGSAGVSLALVIEPSDAARMVAADPTGDGFSEQLFTPIGRATVVDRFRAAVAALRAHGRLDRAELRVRGVAGPAGQALVYAAWDAGGFHLADAEVAPVGSVLLAASGEAEPVRVARPIDEIVAEAPGGGYFVIACEAGDATCMVLAAVRR